MSQSAMSQSQEFVRPVSTAPSVRNPVLSLTKATPEQYSILSSTPTIVMLLDVCIYPHMAHKGSAVSSKSNFGAK